MKYFISSIFILSFCVQPSYSQAASNSENDSSETVNKEQVKNVLYLELAGIAGLYSINYERRLNDQLWGRIGAGYFPTLVLAKGDFITVPIGVSYLLGGHTSFFELGLGTTFAYAQGEMFFSSEEVKEFGVAINATIGHRLQPPDKNFFFKIAFTPLFNPTTGHFFPSGGLSLGYSF